MNYIFLFLFLSIATVCNAQTDQFSYEIKMISSGRNSPDFNPYSDSLDRLMVSLHKGQSASDFQKQYKWSEEKYNKAIHYLKGKNFLYLKDGKPIPSCMIITSKDGVLLTEKGKIVAESIAAELVKVKGEIIQLYQTTNLSKLKPFDSISFFLLSDVLLDNWQIQNVENLFLGQPERPLRHTKNYYLAYMEKSKDGREPFGIYGNRAGKPFAIYGNNRGNINAKVVNEMLEQLPVIDSVDNLVLNKMADLFTAPLIKVLTAHKTYINDVYTHSVYSRAISFAEFFIWWYHFIYTITTNMLAERGELILPQDGNFIYRMK